MKTGETFECGLCGWTTDRSYVAELHALGCRQDEERSGLEPLSVLLEAELILMEHWAERHGCGCARHRPWAVTA